MRINDIYGNYNTILSTYAEKNNDSISFRNLGTKLLPQSVKLKDLYIDLGFRADSLGNPDRNGIGRSNLKYYIKRHNSITLLGSPGSGKSFFIKHILSEYKTFDFENNRWPLCINMCDYVKKCTEKNIRFSDYIYAEILRILGDSENVYSWFQKTISSGEAFIIVEDIDAAAFRTKDMIFALNTLEEFLNMIISLGNKVLLTSRVLGYGEVRLKLPQQHAECYLSGFSDDDIVQYANKWAVINAKNENAFNEYRDNLLDLVSASFWNREMSSNPSLLTRLAVISLNGSSKNLHQMETIELVVDNILRGGEDFRGTEQLVNIYRDSSIISQSLGPLALEECLTQRKQLGFSAQALSSSIKKILPRDLNGINPAPLNVYLYDPFCHLLHELDDERLSILFEAFQYYFAGYSLTEKLFGDNQKAFLEIKSMLSTGDFRPFVLAVTSAVSCAIHSGVNTNEILEKLQKFDIEGLGLGPILSGFVLSELPKIASSSIDAEKIKSSLLQILTEEEFSTLPKIRAWSGNVLAKLGDVRPEVITIESIQFNEIFSGSYYFCHDDTEPWEMEYVYYLGRYPVTWAQFQAFSSSEYYNEREYYPVECDSWFYDNEAHNVPFFNDTVLNLNQPAIAITWYEAFAFCKWLNKLAHEKGWLDHNWEIRLPYENEWVKAARGGLQIPDRPKRVKLNEFKTFRNTPKTGTLRDNPNSHRCYSWEDDTSEPEISTGEFGLIGPTPVGAFPKTASPYGCEEMIGNVWEWLDTEWGDSWSHPKDIRTRMETRNSQKVEGKAMMVKGGSFLVANGDYAQESKMHLAIDYLTKNHSDVRHVSHGFRLCLTPIN